MPTQTEGQHAGDPRELPNRAPSNPAPAKAGVGRRKVPVVPVVPVIPPTAEEIQQERDILRQLQDLHANLIRRNLETAVALAQQALRQGGELAEHFGELGRRFGHLLEAPPKPKLRVVKGGAA